MGYLAKQIRKIDTMEELTNVAQLVLQGIVVFVTKVVPAVTKQLLVADEILNLISNLAGVLLTVKIVGKIMEWIKWQKMLGYYKEISTSHKYAVRLEYAETLVEALDDIGDKPMPESLKKDIQAFFIQEAKDAEDFIQFAQYVETVRERIDKREQREKKKKKPKEKNPSMVLQPAT